MAWSICPVKGCFVPIPDRLAFCKKCWESLTPAMQERIASLWDKPELAQERRRAIADAGKAIGLRQPR